MRLPPILIEEATRLIAEAMERHAAAEQGVKPLRWEEFPLPYQAIWRQVVGTALEMGITIILRDAMQYLDHTNGDLGGAFAKALKRYMRERLDVETA